MSKESLIKILKTLCDYNTVEIQHTFGTNEKPLITVRCIKNTSTIEITYLESQTIELFDSIEESAEVIQLLINKNATL